MADFSFQAVLNLVSAPFVKGARAAAAALNHFRQRGERVATAQARLARATKNTSTAQAQQGRSGQRLAQAAQRLRAALQTIATAAKQAASAARQAGAAFDSAAEDTRQLEKSSTRAGSHLRTLFQVATGSLLLRSLSQGVNAAQELDNRLRTLTRTEAARLVLYQAIFEISQKSYGNLNATTASYQLLAGAVGALGLSQQQTLRIQETANKAIALGGSSAQQAAAGMIQFVQALGGGVLRAEEYNSLIEQTPGLLDAITTGLREVSGFAGVGRENLRGLVIEGELTAEVLVRALTAAAADVDARFSQLAPTLSHGFTQIKNAAQDSFRGLQNEAGIISSALSKLAENFYLVEAAGIVAAAAVGRKVVLAAKAGVIATLAMARAGYTQVAALATQAAATAGFAAVTRIAITATLAFNAALRLAGGVPGVLATVLVGAAAGWALWGDSAAEAATDTEKAVDRIAAALDSLSKATPGSRASEAALQDTGQIIADQKEKISVALDTLERQQARLAKLSGKSSYYGGSNYFAQEKLKSGIEAQSQALRQLREELAALEKAHQQSSGAHKAQEENDRQTKLLEKEQQVLQARVAVAERKTRLIGLSGVSLAKQKHEDQIAQIDAEQAAETKRIQALEITAARKAALIKTAGELAEAQRAGAVATLKAAKASDGHSKSLAAERLAAQRLGEAENARARLQSAQDRLRLASTDTEKEHLDARRAIERARIKREAESQINSLRARKASADEVGLTKESARLETLIKQAEATQKTLLAALAAEGENEEEEASSTDNVPPWLKRGQEAATKASQGIVNGMELASATGVKLFESLGDGMVTAFTRGQAAAKEYFKSVLADIASLIAKQAVLHVVSGLFPAPGGGGATKAPTAHTGGVVGSHRIGSNPTRFLPASLFTIAQRLHSGGLALHPGEVPAILMRGEEVLTRRDPRHVANRQGGMEVRVTINNNTSASAAAQVQQTPGGGLDVQVQLDEAVAKALADPNSRTALALRQMGINRPLEGR